MTELCIRENVDLRPFTTLRAGGRAERLVVARDSETLTQAVLTAPAEHSLTVLGYGSNVLPSDGGVQGLVVVNLASRIRFEAGGRVMAEAGCSFQELFLKTAQAGLSGLEFAVGIPGTLGGALVSNAGAYRSNIGDLVTALEVAFDGERRWVEPEWLQFSYRDTILRHKDAPRCAIVAAKLQLEPGSPRDIYDRARDIQRKRISKQPAPASAGSFFKNVENREFAAGLKTLPRTLREAGVVPAGFLLEHAGMMGERFQGAMIATRHGNFILNVGGASATAIRILAERAKRVVGREFGVTLEEEVLYLGDWSAFA